MRALLPANMTGLQCEGRPDAAGWDEQKGRASVEVSKEGKDKIELKQTGGVSEWRTGRLRPRVGSERRRLGGRFIWRLSGEKQR